MKMVMGALAVTVAGLGAVMVGGTPACVEEDGSGQTTCVWVAPDRGNGVGRSFIVVGGVDLTLPSEVARALGEEK